MAEPKHFTDLKNAKHVEPGSADGSGGACLTGHVGSYKESNTCSYRWQAVQAYSSGEGRGHVEGRANRYITPVVTEDLKKKLTSRYVTAATRKLKRKKYVPPAQKYPAKLPAPRAGAAGANDWGITGPDTDWPVQDEKGKTLYTVRATKNFKGARNESTWPYWNNAHHIIPKATLNKAISDVENPEGWDAPFHLKTAIKRFLLIAKYNVNHHRNVILLPMDKEVGKIVGLPRHLVLEDDEALAELDNRGNPEKSPKFNHENYNNLANSRLIEIMDQFQKAAEKAWKSDECVTKEMEAAKDMLERLSKDLHQAILVQGETGLGDPISLLTEEDLAVASKAK